MSGVSDQKAKANLVKGFELLSVRASQPYDYYGESKRALFRLVANKQNYAPACFEVFLKRNNLFYE